jgi:protein-S-isoprenylcysteine O-methyltransferase Ste14
MKPHEHTRRHPALLGMMVVLNLAIALVLMGLAWGNVRDFYRDGIRDFALAFALLPTIAVLFTSRGSKGVRHAEEGRFVLVGNLVWQLILFAMIYLRGHRLAVLPGDGPLRWTGLAVLGLGTFFRAGSMLELGRRFSVHVALQEEHTLRTTGLYAHVRHPSYVGLLLIIPGLAMVFESQLGVLAAVLAVLRLKGRMEREEKFLLEQFGDQYRDYMARTKRLLPGIY